MRGRPHLPRLHRPSGVIIRPRRPSHSLSSRSSGQGGGPAREVARRVVERIGVRLQRAAGRGAWSDAPARRHAVVAEGVTPRKGIAHHSKCWTPCNITDCYDYTLQSILHMVATCGHVSFFHLVEKILFHESLLNPSRLNHILPQLDIYRGFHPKSID